MNQFINIILHTPVSHITPDFIIYQDDKCAYIEHFGITESGKTIGIVTRN